MSGAELTKRLVSTIGAYGSLAALAITWRAGKPLGLLDMLLIAVAIALGTIGVVYEVADYRKLRPLIFDRDGIQGFMRSWIEEGGNVAIFSRNLSWVDDPMKSILAAKAAGDELTLVVPKTTQLTDELARLGARIHDYPELEYVIQSRFTIVHLHRADAAVAVGRVRDDGRIRVEKFRAGDQPSFFLAEDMIEFVSRYHSRRGTSDGSAH